MKFSSRPPSNSLPIITIADSSYMKVPQCRFDLPGMSNISLTLFIHPPPKDPTTCLMIKHPYVIPWNVGELRLVPGAR